MPIQGLDGADQPPFNRIYKRSKVDISNNLALRPREGCSKPHTFRVGSNGPRATILLCKILERPLDGACTPPIIWSIINFSSGFPSSFEKQIYYTKVAKQHHFGCKAPFIILAPQPPPPTLPPPTSPTLDLFRRTQIAHRIV